MLILPVYLLFLGTASAVAGVYGHRLAAALGLVPGYELSLVVTAGLACVFAALQLAWIAFLRFFFPSRSGTPLVTEMLSLSAAVLLAPIFLGLRVPGLPDVTLPSAIGLFGRADNLIFLAAFAVAHLGFKLMTLFAVTRTEPSSRLNALFWIGACIAATSGAQWSFLEWRADVFSPRVLLAAELPLRPARVKDIHAEARLLPEGATVVFDMAGHGAEDLVFWWALPDNVDDAGTVFASIEIDGRPVSAAPFTLDFSASPWAEIRVPTAKFNELATKCAVRWSRKQDAAWLSQMGFHAPPAPGSEILLAGPAFHPPTRSTAPFGVVLVAIDGLGAADVRGAEDVRPVTPALFALGGKSLRYENAFTPAPDSVAACMTLLTGVDPLRHGFLGTASGPLPAGIRGVAGMLRENGFVTAAFTEGLPHGSGIERGFDLFDASRPEKGAADTLRAAWTWIEAHRDQRFFAFIRLSEGAALEIAPRHDGLFAPRDGSAPSPADIHDNALAYMDRLLGDFFERLDGAGLFQRGCLAVAGTHGLDLQTLRPGHILVPEEARRLTEPCLHVPLWVRGADLRPSRHTGLTPLARVAPMLLEAAGVEGDFNGESLGRYGSYLRDLSEREVISMAGDPLALSLRTGRWRYTWQSGRNPFTGQITGEASVKAFLDMHRYAEGHGQGNYYRSESRLADGYRGLLEEYLAARLPGTAVRGEQ